MAERLEPVRADETHVDEVAGLTENVLEEPNVRSRVAVVRCRRIAAGAGVAHHDVEIAVAIEVGDDRLPWLRW